MALTASLARPARAQLFQSRAPGVRSCARPATVAQQRVGQAADTEGPGSGLRRYPTKLESLQVAQRDTEAHQLKSTVECYQEFPYLIKISVPLRVEDPTPAGLSARQTPDAGPATGRRRRPAAVDAEAQRHPPALPHPAAPRDLKRELLLRSRILLTT